MLNAGNEVLNNLKVHGAGRVELDDVKQTLLGAGIRTGRIERQNTEAEELEGWRHGERVVVRVRYNRKRSFTRRVDRYDK
jgi:hypothetical protein